MDSSQLKWIADFIWNSADDRLRDVYVRGKYRDVILPFTVLRRLDAVLESIIKSARTGKIGDGKIFVLPVDQVVRIRTGETDNAAI